MHGELLWARELKAVDEQMTAVHTAMKAAQTGRYIWRTVGDEKVRSSHAVNDGRIFSWDEPPPTGHPGEDHNCRCFAEPIDEPVIYDPPIEPVYPELILLPLLKVGRGALQLASRVLGRMTGGARINKVIEATGRGAIRQTQRNIKPSEIRAAIRTAKRTGNITTKTGRYGTLQHRYHGKNGVTVVIETEGRNAGKIITVFRNVKGIR